MGPVNVQFDLGLRTFDATMKYREDREFHQFTLTAEPDVIKTLKNEKPNLGHFVFGGKEVSVTNSKMYDPKSADFFPFLDSVKFAEEATETQEPPVDTQQSKTNTVEDVNTENVVEVVKKMLLDISELKASQTKGGKKSKKRRNKKRKSKRRRSSRR